MVKKLKVLGYYTVEKNELQKLYSLVLGEGSYSNSKGIKSGIFRFGLLATASIIVLAYLIL
jgi:hypothetical protein